MVIGTLLAVHATGGRVRHESPANVLALLEPFVREFLLSTSATLAIADARPVGVDLQKSWLLPHLALASQRSADCIPMAGIFILNLLVVECPPGHG